MDSTQLKRVHKALNVLVGVFFVAFVALIALLVKDSFFADCGKLPITPLTSYLNVHGMVKLILF